MTRKDKLISRLFSTPPPKDFSWEELLKLMNHGGFSETCSGGSHYIFEHPKGLRLSVSKTHPSGILKTYQIKAIRQALRDVAAEGVGNG